MWKLHLAHILTKNPKKRRLSKNTTVDSAYSDHLGQYPMALISGGIFIIKWDSGLVQSGHNSRITFQSGFLFSLLINNYFLHFPPKCSVAVCPWVEVMNVPEYQKRLFSLWREKGVISRYQGTPTQTNTLVNNYTDSYQCSLPQTEEYSKLRLEHPEKDLPSYRTASMLCNRH